MTTMFLTQVKLLLKKKGNNKYQQGDSIQNSIW